jgi:prevent-host-death family protein
MEKIVGIKTIRPKLGEYLKRAEEGEVLIVSSRSEPKGVILGYSTYKELKALAQKAKQLEIAQILNNFRNNAEKAGLSESDVQKEIEEVRK